ncbi:Cadherin-related family member 5 [Anabarilius grahami]|uniref:Cadherin-related family member 5 n=1 Tax=Anabarilius grahami TaxID=495550 RepID=A0A3N0Y1U6_ANAGA|nr:Cadherin-related family member 5 [Anabarilius grahami]
MAVTSGPAVQNSFPAYRHSRSLSISRYAFLAKASECDGGHDVFATVKENSLMGTFIANLSFTAHPSANHMHLKLFGKDAGWFYLEGRTVRLNSTSARIIDREAEHRIMVEVLNVNDNKPEFPQSSIQPLQLSELTAVNSVAFTVQATDADGDTLTYIIDEKSPDARYFRVDLHNSGKVILNKSLDYEIKTQLRLTIYAVETNTNEHYNTTATVIINVTDGDDQYPQFQPCTLLSANHSNRICANPLYTANITENEQDIVLDFFPGPIQALDGDEGLRTPVKYSILSGADNGRFVIDSSSGEVRLTRRVENRLLIPTLRLRVMTLSALLSKHLKIMDLINWSLNAIDTIFSTRSLGSGEPDCPAGTFAAGYTMDAWEKWRVVCLAALSVEDIEDIYLFGTMITGLLLIGLGFALVYRENRKTVTAVQNLTRLPVMIEAVGRAVSTETGTINRNMDNIMEKLTALQRQLDRFGDQNGLRE